MQAGTILARRARIFECPFSAAPDGRENVERAMPGWIRSLLRVVVVASLASSIASAAERAPVARPELPTACLDRALRAERRSGADRSEPLAQALLHVASQVPD